MIYVGIDLGGTNIAAGIVDESGKLLHKKSIPTGADRDASAVIKDMAQVAMDVVAENGYSMDDVVSVGIGSPGSVDKAKGELVYANNLPFSHTPMRAEMQKYINKPIYIDNDANCAAWAEAMAGATKGVDDSIAITLGTGVGGGIVVNGKLYSGFNFIGGELGHTVIAVDGEPCSCGRKGCWEAYASATALIRQTKRAAEAHKDSKMWDYTKDGKFSGRTAFQAAKDGDKAAQEVVDNYVKYVGCGIANMINIFQPEVLVVGGGIANEGDNLLNPVREYVKKETYAKDIKACRIEKAYLGNDAGIIGAALLKE